MKGGRLVKSKTLIITSAVPLWSFLDKWRYTASVVFWCLILKQLELNLCAMEFLVCPTYCVVAGFACNAVDQV